MGTLKYSSYDIVLQEIPNEITLSFTITGCGLRCVGCHSEYLWDKNNGEELTNELFLSLLKKDEVLNIPVAHHDGNYYIDSDGLKELEENGQILLKYCDENGSLVNMNGSVSNIAGICNKEKNVFGLMPHPERAIEKLLGSTDGINMLKGFLQ